MRFKPRSALTSSPIHLLFQNPLKAEAVSAYSSYSPWFLAERGRVWMAKPWGRWHRMDVDPLGFLEEKKSHVTWKFHKTFRSTCHRPRALRELSRDPARSTAVRTPVWATHRSHQSQEHRHLVGIPVLSRTSCPPWADLLSLRALTRREKNSMDLTGRVSRT